jgi:cytochrome c
MVRVLTASAAMALVIASAAPATAADISQGKAVFSSQCGVCHSNARGGGVIIGPPLFGVIGRKAGSVAGFDYSSAMKSAGFAWTPERLEAYLPAPRDYLPGVKMTYAGLKDPAKRDNLIAYLATLR